MTQDAKNLFWKRVGRLEASAALALTLLAPMSAAAQDTTLAPTSEAAATSAETADAATVAETLKPGQWTWTPEAAAYGPLRIYVDLSLQVAVVYRGGERIGATTVSSGRAGYETPTGVFAILNKDANHHSKKYDDAPMPFSERLTWDGVALHAGRVPGYPESHGCVHLPYSFAKALFSVTQPGTTVIMSGEAPVRGRSIQATAKVVNALPAQDSPKPIQLATNR